MSNSGQPAFAVDFTKSFRLSLVALTRDTSGNRLQPSVSLSKGEAKQIGQTKDDKTIGNITLNQFWNRIGRNQFCLPDGSLVISKTTLSEYVEAALPHYSDALNKLAEDSVYTVAYLEKTRVPSPQKAGDAPFSLTLHTFESGLPAFGTLPDVPTTDPNAIAQQTASDALRPAQMKVGDWNEVLFNNNLLNGFIIDQKSKELFRARKTAFKLEPNPINPLLFSPGTVSSGLAAKVKKIAEAAANPLGVNKVDLGSHDASSASGTASSGTPASDADGGPSSGPSTGSDAGSDSGQPETDPDLPVDEPLQSLYPLWEISDDSSIEIETISSKLQLAFAQQGFSSVDVQAAASASALSFGASGSAGFGTSSKTASSQENGSESLQMHASYNFPRVRLFLDEDSISLSPDCTAALTAINKTKSYSALMGFYESFGHLFVTRAKLGGRLRATQYLAAGEHSASGSEEDAWKASLAASFSTAMASGSASSSVENASSTESKSASSNMNNAVAWEAQGGDTTLGNNPASWCNTVDKPGYWRVVKQEVVVPIEDIISRIPGFEGTRALFAGIALDHLMEATPVEIPWNGASGAVLGSGISSCSIVAHPNDVLRTTALDVVKVSNTDVSSGSGVQWYVVHDKPSMQSYLEKTFRQTINALVGTRLYPNLVWRLGTSDRAFSVILNLRSGLKKSTAASFSVLERATQMTDPTSWQTTFGDFFIRSIVEGTALSVCWTFISQTRGAELNQARIAVATLFSSAQNSFESGCHFLSRLAMDFPCQAYFYDAYYQETVLSSPADVMAKIKQHQGDVHARQIVSVGLEPYINIEALQRVAAKTISSPVPSAALEVVRRDEAAYVYEASKWQSELSIVPPSDPSYATWQGYFSSTTYNATVEKSSTANTVATGLVQNYNNLFSRASAVVNPQSPVWPAIYGTTDVLQATLQWLRKSRQQEMESLSKPVPTTGMTIFGLNTQPQPAAATPPAVPTLQTAVAVTSLRKAYIDAGLEQQIDTTDPAAHSLDKLWVNVTNAADYGNLPFQKPALVVAYQMTPTAIAGSAPAMIIPNSVVQLNVGMDLTDFANLRTQTPSVTPGFAVYDVWVVYGPLRYSDIAS
ncbi:hypothetical protein LX32DRAFT_651041 [Colletotrichum zoysiae]|uniref:MACPF-like domain-containing protein n=1 Tax=Colletotrichum zoysiae TaxID=1216348 RepID=A0AAD9HLH3_9PEZI|nr:hypothetical protein LX32DRAFT_651041 [Colletotrichum zoysiae]